MGSYAPALCILFATLVDLLFRNGVSYVFCTGNRLGGFYLKKRKYTKTEIKNFVKEQFTLGKITDHEADSLLQAYSICRGIYGFDLGSVNLRKAEVIVEECNFGR